MLQINSRCKSGPSLRAYLLHPILTIHGPGSLCPGAILNQWLPHNDRTKGTFKCNTVKLSFSFKTQWEQSPGWLVMDYGCHLGRHARNGSERGLGCLWMGKTALWVASVCVCVFRGPRHLGSLCGSCPRADSLFQLLLTTRLLLPGPIILATQLGWLFTALFKAQWINAYFPSSSPAAETIKALEVARKGAIWFGKDCVHSPPPNTRKHTTALMSNFYLIPSFFLACLSIVQTCLALAFEACARPI